MAWRVEWGSVLGGLESWREDGFVGHKPKLLLIKAGFISTYSVQSPAPSFQADPFKRVLPGLQYFLDNTGWSRWTVRRWRRVQVGLDWCRNYRWSLECGRFRGWDSGECVAGFHRAWLETILLTSQITGSPPLLSDWDTLCEMEHEGHRCSSRLNKSEEEWSLMWNAICC